MKRTALAALVLSAIAQPTWAEDKTPAPPATPGATPAAAATPAKAADKLNAKADEAAEEEAKKARDAREARVPSVVVEKAREAVSKHAEPTLAYEQYRRQIEIKVADKRKELIGYLDEILRQNPAETEKPDLLFQKAELYLEEGQFHFFQGMQLDDTIAEALSSGDDKKVLDLTDRKDKEVDLSKKWGKDAIALFAEIEKKYPKFDRMPDVLYSMGQAFWDSQEYKDALRIYRKIIEGFPKSQYMPDAWLAFGEYYFQVAPDGEKDLKKALDAYIKAAANQESQVFGYATYKQGWCYYNLSRHDKATEKFKEVILYSQLNADILGNRRIGLAREARKDYVLAYAQYGTAANAPGEFKSVADGDEQRQMLERLADIFYGDGKDRDAIVMYQTLMKMTPDNTKNPLFQGKIVKLASRIGEKRQVVGQARKLVDEYKRVRQIFLAIPDGDKRKEPVGEDLKNADEVSDNTIRYLATTWHNEAKKTLDNSTFEYAYELYGDYLDLFPDRREAYEMRFFYAELLYRLEKFELAGEQYLKVFLADKGGKWAEPAAEEAVRAYDEVVKDYDRANKSAAVPTGTEALKERPIPEIKKKYLAACKNYVDSYPKGKIVVESRYKIERVQYDYNYFSESTPRFMELVATYPDHARAEQAANLVLDTYNIQEDWTKLNDAARTFSQNRTLMKNKDFKDVLAKVLEESSFKLITAFEKKKQWDEAAKRYLAYGEEFPKSALADKAFANAAAMYTRAGQLDRAIKVRTRLVNDYKDSPLVPDQMFAIASSYEQIVAYRDAATWLEKFVEAYPKDSRARDALFNASIYRHGTGDTPKAVTDREAYLKAFPDVADAEDVAYSVATAWEESGNLKKAIDSYNDFATKWRKKDPARALNAQYKAFRLLEKNKGTKTETDRALADLELQSNAYRKLGKSVDDVGDPLALVAFREADIVFAKFKDLKIAKPDKPADFKKTLQQKREAKDEVYKAYTEVVKLKSPEWAVASLYRIGEANAHLVKAITDVPPPKGLTDEQSQLFRDKLSEQTLPIDDQAAQAMSLCLDKSAEFAVFNDWTRRCLGYLEENRPNTYPKDALELRSAVKIATKPQERGQGYVLELPKLGERPKLEPGSEPPPPPQTAAPAAQPGKKASEFEFDGSEGAK